MARFLVSTVLILALIAVYTMAIFRAGFQSGFEAGASLVTYVEEKV